jgi:hypothetical protein
MKGKETKGPEKKKLDKTDPRRNAMCAGHNETKSAVINEVEKAISTELEKNKQDLEYAQIKPLHEPDYLYSTNGVYLMCGKMGSGKTFWIMRHILICDRLFPKPYYDQVLFTSTSQGLDKTVQTIESQCRTKITYIPDDKILPHLQKLMKRKMKFYALTQYIKFKKISKEMEKLIEEKRLYQWNKTSTKYVPDPKKIAVYFEQKMQKWKEFKGYPSNTLLILDDFAGHPLIRTPETPMNRLFTKTRHYNLTVCLGVQSWRMVCLNFKRLCTDINIYSRYSEVDFKKMINQTPSGLAWEPLWEEYRNLEDKHAKLVINITAQSYHFDYE